MGVYRQFSDPAGVSHLEKLSQDQRDQLLTWQNAKALRLHVHAPGTFLDWHPAGGKFAITVLSGKLEIGVSDGTRLLCQPGDLRFTSDAGKGHTGRVIGDEPCVVLMVDLGK